MYKVCVLNSFIPKIKKTENLYAKRRHWYSNGSLYYYPHIKTCSTDVDCLGSQLCVDNHCIGLDRKYDLHGVHYGPEYRQLIQDNSPLAHINVQSYDYVHGFFHNQPEDIYDYEKHGYNHDYDYS